MSLPCLVVQQTRPPGDIVLLYSYCASNSLPLGQFVRVIPVPAEAVMDSKDYCKMGHSDLD